MDKSLYKLKDMISAELKKIADEGKLTANTLDQADKLTHSLKSIQTVIAMQEREGYSNDMPARYTMHHDDYRPHYSYDRYDYGYSRDEKSHTADRLRRMMEEATTDKERNAIRNCLAQME